jgi:glycosyltransferase involved in cell wall biosynthesis
LRETEIEKSGDETQDLMFEAHRDRAQMARRLNSEIIRRNELEKRLDRSFTRYKIVDRISDFLHRIPLLPGLGKSAARLLANMRRSKAKGNSVSTDGAVALAAASVPAGFGINLAGHLHSEKGVGEGARATLRSIRAAQIPCQLVNSPDEGSSNIEKLDSALSKENPYDFNLVHINADAVPAFSDRHSARFWDRYNIGFWAWELPSLPPFWCKSFRFFDEVWVPSTFCLDAVSRSSPVPVVRVPHSIHEDIEYDQEFTRSQLGIGPDTFVFLFFFDFHSFMERKNPIGLIEAFQKAFTPKDDALLFIKCSRSSWDPASMARLQEASRGANVRLFDSVISRPALNSLVSICDSYVSLHRSEGFGLTLTEAMNMGKPVIATGYSGNMDFMTLSNSYPVKYRLIEIKEDHGCYTKGNEWADPDLDHAAELMRHAYTHRDEAAEVGKRAQIDVCSQLNPRVVGRIIRERLLKANDEAEVRRKLSYDLASNNGRKIRPVA